MLLSCYNEDQEFERLENRITDVSPKKVKDAVDGYVDYLVNRILNNKYDLSILLERSAVENTQLFNDTWEQVKNRLLAPIAQLRKKEGLGDSKEDDKALREIIENNYPGLKDQAILADNKDAFLSEISKRFKQYGIGVSIKMSEAELNEDSDEKSLKEPTRDGVHVDPLTVDPRSNVSTLVKLTLSTIPKEFYKEDGTIQKKQSLLFMPVFNEFEDLNRFLLVTGVGAQNLTELFQQIDDSFLNPKNRRYSDKNLWIPELKRRLNLGKEQLSTEEKNLILAFESTYCGNMKADAIKMVFGKKGENRVYNPNERDNNQDAAVEWENNLKLEINQADLHNKQEDKFFTQTNSGLVINRNSAEYKDFISLYNSIKNTSTPSEKNLTSVLEKLKLLGIEFKVPMKDILQNTTRLASETKSNFYIIVESYKEIVDVLKREIDTGGQGREHPVKTFDDLLKNESNGRILNLAKVYNNLNPSEQSFMVLTPEGKGKYTLTRENGTGKIVRAITDAKSIIEMLDNIPHLSMNRYFNPKTNITVSTLFNPQQNKFQNAFYKQDTILGIGVEDSDEGTSTNSLSINDRILQELNNILKNRINLGINGDKSTDWAQSMWKPYLSFKDTLSDERGKVSPKITKHWLNLLKDEMDAGYQEIVNRGYVDHYQDNVWKLGYFRDILNPVLIHDFIEEVLQAHVNNPQVKKDKWTITRPDSFGTDEEYEIRKTAFFKKNYDQITKEIEQHIETTASKYIDKLVKCGAITKTFDKVRSVKEAIYSYSISGLTRADVRALLGDRDLGSLREKDIQDLSRYINVNYEIARNEQHKFHFGHPSYYADLIKRYSLWMGVAKGMSSDPVILNGLDDEFPRTDFRQDTISLTNPDKYIRHLTYAEQVYMVKGYEQIAENLHKAGISDENIGAKFNEDGTFKELILKDGKPQGSAGKYLGIKGADSQLKAGYDFFWRYKTLLKGLTSDEKKLREYDWAYEIYNLGRASEESGRKFNYPDAWISKAKGILEKYNWTEPTVAIESTKPSYAGFSKAGVPVGLKMSMLYTCFRTVEGTADEAAYIAHKRAGIDTYGWQSGQKMGALTEDDGSFVHYYDQSGSYSGRIPKIQYLDPSGMREQVQSSTHDDVVGSQMAKQISADLPEHLLETQTQLDQAMRDLSSLATHELIQDAGIVKNEDGTYSVKDATNFSAKLTKALSRAGISANQLQAIKTTDLGDGRHVIETPFDATPIKDPIEYMIWSMINGQVVNPRYFGVPAVQTPMHGREEKRKPVEYAYLNEELKKYEYLSKIEVAERNIPQNKLHIVVPQDKVQRVEAGELKPVKNFVPWPYSGLKIQDKTTGKKRALHPKDLGLVKHPGGIWKAENLDGTPIEGLDLRIFNTIGFRIPTPGPTSITAGEGEGFHDPTHGSIMSKYASEIARGDDDFDYDKFNLMFPEFKIKNKDFKSAEFLAHMNAHLEALGYAAGSADLQDESTYNTLNQSAFTETGREYHDTEHSLESLAQGNKELEKTLKDIKRGLQSWNSKFKHIILEMIDPEEQSEKGLKNKIWSLRWKLMTDPERYASIMTPISMGDVSTDAKRIRDILKKSSNENNVTLNLQLAHSELMRQAFLIGKKNLGPVARAAAMHAILQRGDLRLTGNFDEGKLYYLYFANRKDYEFNKDSLKDKQIEMIFPHNTKEGKPFFGAMLDAEQNNISESFTSRLQSILEIVKKPDITDVGINGRTVGTADYLTELGVPNSYVHFFFTQPIIKEYCAEMDDDESMSNSVSGKRIWESGVVYKMMRLWDGKKWTKASFFESKAKREFYDRILPKLEELKSVSMEQLEKGLLATKGTKEEGLFQMQILFRFLQYKAQAGSTFTLNQYIGDDTASIKTFDEYTDRLKLKKQVEDSGMFEGVDTVVNGSFVGEIKDSLAKLNAGLRNYFVSMDDRLEQFMTKSLEELSKTYAPGETKKKLINKRRRFVANYLLQTLPGLNNKIISTHAKELLIGENSIPNQVAVLRRKYTEDLFLTQLQPLLSQVKGHASGLRPLSMSNTPIDIEQMILTVLNDSRGKRLAEEDLRTLLKDIVYYSLIHSGGQPSRDSIDKLIPYELWTKVTKDLLDSFKYGTQKIDIDLMLKQYKQNYFRKDPTVPLLSSGGDDEKPEFSAYSKALTTGDGTLQQYFTRVPLSNSKSDSEFVQIYRRNKVDAKQYLINKRAQNGLNGTYLLYQKIPGAFQKGSITGIREDGESYSIPTTFQIYRRINIKGVPGTHNAELHVTDYQQSIHPQNEPFNELDPRIQTEIKALINTDPDIWKFEKKDLPLQGPPDTNSNIIGNSSESDDSEDNSNMLEEDKKRLSDLEEAKAIHLQSNPDIIIAQNIPKITPASAKKETGGKTGSGSDINPSFLSKTGMSIDAAAHYIMEDYFHEKSGFTQDESYIKDVIIEVLTTGKNAFIDNIVRQSEIDALKKTLNPGKVKKEITSIPLSTNFSRESVAKDPTHLYLFTDNARRSSGANRMEAETSYAKRYGRNTYPNVTQAVIRGLENAYPITTMVDDNRTQWTDIRFDEYKKIIDSEIDHIKEAMQSGQYKAIKFAAQMPFGKGKISNMKQSAPKIWQYMNMKLQEIGINNWNDKPTVYQEPSNIVKDFAGKEYTQAEWDKLQSDTRKNFDENGIYKELSGKVPTLFDQVTPENVDNVIRRSIDDGDIIDLCNKGK